MKVDKEREIIMNEILEQIYRIGIVPVIALDDAKDAKFYDSKNSIETKKNDMPLTIIVQKKLIKINS